MPTFEELSDLAQFVKPNKIKDLVIVGTTSNPTTKLDQLYHGLTHGHFVDDAMAAEQVLGCSARDAAYYKLKGRLHEKLINTSLLNDNSDNPTYVSKFIQCHKLLMAAKVLILQGHRNSAVPLLKKGLKTSQRLEHTETSLSFAKILRTHYGSINGDQSSFEKYNQMVQKYTHLYVAETRAEGYYNSLIVHFVHSSATKPELQEIAKKYCKVLKREIKKRESFQLYFLTYLTFLLRYQISNDNKNIIRVGKEALSYFEKKENPHLLRRGAFHISLKVLASYTQTRKYLKAKEIAQKCLRWTKDGLSNWFITLDFIIVLENHSKDYNSALSVFLKAYSHPNYTKQYDYISERWELHKAFLYYLKVKEQITSKEQVLLPKFRISKFINEVPSYSKDKRGTNTIILILHILFLLQQEKYSAIIDRVESLKTYTHRYLRRDDTFRSNCFIKMLIQLPAANFHREAVVRKANPYWKKLLSVPLHKANQAAELEIIPYETLWEFVLDSLDNKFH